MVVVFVVHRGRVPGLRESVPILGSVWGRFSPRSVLPLALAGPPLAASGAVSYWAPRHMRREVRESGR